MSRALLSAVTTIVLFGGAGLSAAQGRYGSTEPLDQLIPKTIFVKADGREALKKVAAIAGVPIQIDPQVRGTVTLTLEHTHIASALEMLAGHLDADLRIENGMVEVVPPLNLIPASLNSFFTAADAKHPKHNFALSGVSIQTAAEAILGDMPYQIVPGTEGYVTLRFGGVSRPRAFAAFLRAAGLRFRMHEGRIQIYRPGDASEMTFHYEGARVRDVLKLLFFDQGFTHKVSPDVLGCVDAKVENRSFETALQIVTREIDATYREEEGVFHIIRRMHCDEWFGEPSEPPPPPAPVPNQDPDEALTRIVPAVDYENAEVRDLLRNLFRDTGLSYTIAPEIQGTVTMSLRNLTFETVLQHALRQVDATYRIEGGVFHILKRVPSPPVAPDEFVNSVSFTVAPPSLSFDREYLYIVQYDHIFKLRKSDLREADQGPLEVSVTDGKGQPVSPARWILWSQRKIDVAYDRKPIREVVRQLANLGNVQARVDANVEGVVTLQRKGITVAEALAEVAKQVGAQYRRDDGRLHIYRPVPNVGGAAGSPYRPPLPDEPATTAHDGDYLYIVRGHRIDKVRKRDLEVVAVGYLLLKPTPSVSERGG